MKIKETIELIESEAAYNGDLKAKHGNILEDPQQSYEKGYYDGAMAWAFRGQENNTEPKPYNDPSMKEVLEEEFGGEWTLSSTFWGSEKDEHELQYMFQAEGEDCGSKRMPPNFQAILAAHGYFPDDMFERDSNGNYRFKF